MMNPLGLSEFDRLLQPSHLVVVTIFSLQLWLAAALKQLACTPLV